MLIPNVWHLRKVADTSSKACYICYKPTANVLITPDNKASRGHDPLDFFYVCLGHLKDRGFCSPIIDEAEIAAKKKKEEMEREIEKVKREYQEKVNKKKAKEKEKEKGKEKEKEKEKDGDDKKDQDAEDKNAEKEKDDKIKSITDADPTSKVEETPRIYALHKNFYQMRLDRIRNAEIARRNKERLKSPTAFPAVPKGDL